MSLAMFAAPVNNDEEDDDSTMNQRKRHNRTQKKYESNLPKPSNSSSNKVNSVLATIHESMSNLDDSGMGDFNPPPPPVSIGATRAKTNEERKMMQEQREPVSYENGENIQRNNHIIDRFRTIGQSQQGYNQGSSLDMNYLESNYVDDRSAEEYYNKYLPSMINAKPGPMNRMDSQRHLQKRFQNPLRQMNRSDYDTSSAGGESHDVLMQKINYMINLLEEQQDEKVGNVGEEVVLYSFLGIFMIFLVDSFVRVGKYVR